jgi:glutamate N-acetyltransferase/amino-acid N-acetyltransferase
LLYSERECAVAGVFTQNRVRSAPVGVTEARVRAGGLRAVIVNSGNANALTGDEGVRDAEAMATLAARHLGLGPEEAGVASTGVTGVKLPLARVKAALPGLTVTRDGGPAFARGIMTTDTRPKEIALSVKTPVGEYRVAGCAKGSGMIHPNMATMLAYLTTDAAVEPGLLQRALRETADATLNLVTIDGDTSCSDTLLVFANGAAGLPRIDAGGPEEQSFREALLAVCTHLSREIARDGEGASHLIEVKVGGAASLVEARLVAKTIALSSLVKTAIAGCDPNWGRILIAAGRSGAAVDPALARLQLQGVPLYDRGRIVPFDETEMRARLGQAEVEIRLDLGLGDASATAWGCDLTAEYVHINADYTT